MPFSWKRSKQSRCPCGSCWFSRLPLSLSFANSTSNWLGRLRLWMAWITANRKSPWIWGSHFGSRSCTYTWSCALMEKASLHTCMSMHMCILYIYIYINQTYTYTHTYVYILIKQYLVAWSTWMQLLTLVTAPKQNISLQLDECRTYMKQWKSV